MRILIINDSSKESGGAETDIFGTRKLLMKNNNVFLFSFGDNEEKTENKLILKEDKGIKRIFRRFFFSYKVYRKLKNYINETNPDIIHIHNNFAHSLSILKALKKTNIVKIQTVHDWGLVCPSSWCVIKHNLKECEGVNGISLKCVYNGCIKPKHFLLTYMRNKLRLRLSKTIDAFISPSKKLKSYLDRFGFKNTYHLFHFQEFNEEINKEKKENIILYVGVLTNNKGVEYLVKAMKDVNNEVPDAKLVIVGDGKERKYLESLNVKNVDFIGKVKHEEVKNYFNKGKMLVLPSIWMENSPFVVYEAMSFGLPVIGSNRGGIPDLVKDNETGFITRPGDSKDISEKIIRLLKDEDLRKKLGRNAREFMKGLSPEIRLKKLMDIYEGEYKKKL